MRVRIFRWKAIGPLLLVLALMAILVWLFAEPVAKDTTEEVSTELLGTQVDVGKLDILAKEAAVDLQTLEIADPFDVHKNLVQADQIRIKLNPAALAEKKFVVERFAMNGIRFGTSEKDRRPAGRGRRLRAAGAARGPKQWAQQFDVPLLKLTPIDTIKQLVLNPAQLTSVQTAQALVARTDSTRKALEQEFKSLDIESTVDSARRLAERLSATDPRKLGWTGPGRPSRMSRRISSGSTRPRTRLETLERQVRGGVGMFGVRTPGARRSEKEGLRLRPVAASAPVVRRAGDRAGVLRQGQHRPLSEGALLGSARPALHAARVAAAGGPRSQAAARLGPDHPFPEGAGLAQVPRSARPAGPDARRRQRRSGVHTPPRCRGSPPIRRFTASRRSSGPPERRRERDREHHGECRHRPRAPRPGQGLGIGEAPGRQAAELRDPGSSASASIRAGEPRTWTSRCATIRFAHAGRSTRIRWPGHWTPRGGD